MPCVLVSHALFESTTDEPVVSVANGNVKLGDVCISGAEVIFKVEGLG